MRDLITKNTTISLVKKTKLRKESYSDQMSRWLHMIRSKGADSSEAMYLRKQMEKGCL